MKKQFLLFFGLLLYLFSIFVPLANLNEEIITIAPVFGNLIILDGFYSWKDIAIFSLTYILVFFINLYFILKKQHKVIKFLNFLSFFCFIMIFFGLLRIQQNSDGYTNIHFNYSYGLLISLASFILIFIGTKNSNIK
jgi:hypothetical protein